jgi:hypothetical protein
MRYIGQKQIHPLQTAKKIQEAVYIPLQCPDRIIIQNVYVLTVISSNGFCAFNAASYGKNKGTHNENHTRCIDQSDSMYIPLLATLSLFP